MNLRILELNSDCFQHLTLRLCILHFHSIDQVKKIQFYLFTTQVCNFLNVIFHEKRKNIETPFQYGGTNKSIHSNPTCAAMHLLYHHSQ